LGIIGGIEKSHLILAKVVADISNAIFSFGKA
jgi:hypothetical protein